MTIKKYIRRKIEKIIYNNIPNDNQNVTDWIK